MNRTLSFSNAGGALVCSLVLASANAHAQLYEPPTLPVPGHGPETMSVAGDFNGDGVLDLAVGYKIDGEAAAQGIEVFLRTGPSTFAPPVLSPGLPGEWRQAVATDVNNDGRTDLILDTGVLLLVSDGAGGFTPTQLGFSAEWSGLAYADANGDGHPDLLAAQTFLGGFESYKLMLSLGDGQGGFGPFTQVAETGFFKTGQIAAGDLTGDGAPDVLITNRYAQGGVGVFLNDGAGGFTHSSTISTGTGTSAVSLADFDGDSRLDAAVGNSASRNLVILKGAGNGGFAVTSSIPSPGNVEGILLADFNGDGSLDVMVGGDGVWFYAGNGFGFFSFPTRYAARGGPSAIDLNGDGLLDVAAGSWELYNTGGGVLAAPRQYAAGSGVAGVAVGDMNGDGKLDLVTANADSNDVAVLLGNGDASFAAPRLGPAGSMPTFVVVGDWNGDGRRDAAVANIVSRDISVLLGDGAGGLTPSVTLPLSATEVLGLSAGDLNQDGRDDLVVSLNGAGRVQVFLASGNGAFSTGPSYNLPGRPSEIALGAFNPDVRLDAAVGLNPLDPPTSHLYSLLGDGSGSFAPPEAQPVDQLELNWVVVDDLNGDGKLDLVVGGRRLAGDGHGGFVPFPGEALVVEYPKGATSSDFDGDGKRDLAVSAENMHLALGDGSGALAFMNLEFPIGGLAGRPVAADFNGDGRPDLAVGVDDSDVVTILTGEALAPGADVSLSVSHSPDPAQSLGPLALMATVTNQGPLAAKAPVLTLQLPFGVTFVSSNPGAPTCQTSQPNQMNILVTCALADLPSGGSTTVTVTVTVLQVSGSVLPFDTRVATDTPLDPAPLNNLAVHMVPVGAAAPDLAVTLSDSPDPVAPGALFDYIIDVTNVGGSNSLVNSPLVGTLDSVTYSTSSPAGWCTGGVYLQCDLPIILPGDSIQIFVTVVASSPVTSVINSVTLQAPLDPNAQNDSATTETRLDLGIREELVHGKALRESFPPGNPSERLYYVAEEPHSSYEVVVDGASGDVAAAGQTLLVQRLATDLTPVQDAVPAGAGASRTLSFENAGEATPKEVVRVRSTGCAAGCSTGDGYRVRAYETTARIPRFNTTLTQTTVLTLENVTASQVKGNAWLWDEDGELVGSVAFDLGSHQTVTKNLASVAPGRKGTITVSHDGPYGALAGKSSAVEPATGFTFDTPLGYRPR
jgi:hypothetical protein